MFPLMEQDELRALADDIKANGQQRAVVFWAPNGDCPIHNKSRKKAVLLDGRNRLDALELAGVEIKLDEDLLHTVHDGDPYSYVISANIHRRHLTTAQKSELIEKLLKADPMKSDRAIAETAKTSHVTVAAKRAKMEATGQIDQLSERTGKDGKARKQTSKAETTEPAAIVQDAPLRVVAPEPLPDPSPTTQPEPSVADQLATCPEWRMLTNPVTEAEMSQEYHSVIATLGKIREPVERRLIERWINAHWQPGAVAAAE
jgi:hypothetical protein